MAQAVLQVAIEEVLMEAAMAQAVLSSSSG